MCAKTWLAAMVPLLCAQASGSRAQLPDNWGGDDKYVVTQAAIRFADGYCMDIAEDGAIYVAFDHTDPDLGDEVLVYRSTDGGDTWVLWGSRSDPDPALSYYAPSIQIAEGDQDRLYLAYEYADPAGSWTIEVAYSSLNLPAAVWTVHTALGQAGVDFRKPNLSSDEMNFNAYRLYLTAEGWDANGHDIWFTRSVDFGQSWEGGYMLGTLGSVDRDYERPEIRYGRGGVVHCVWLFRIHANDDSAVRYRRAANYAGAPADWSPVVQVTTVTDGRVDECPSLAASHASDKVLIGYYSAPLNGDAGSRLRLSTDAGATWPASTALDLPMGADGPRLLALPAGEGFRIAGYRIDATNRHSFCTSTDAAPLALSPELLYRDGGPDGGVPSVVMDYDASRSNRLALVWPDFDYYSSDDNILFDAEWRRDPGYPNLEDHFPHALASGAVAHPALVNLDDDADLEIVFGDAAGCIQAFNPDASVVPGWPVDIGDFPPTYPAPGGYPTANCAVAVDDLDSDGRPEVVAGSTDGQVCVYRRDGTPLPPWPLNLGAGKDVFVSIGSIVGASRRQIVACAETEVHLLLPNATEAPGFPVAVASALTAPAAIGDLDADRESDLVVVGGDRLNWYDSAGRWHFQLNLAAGNTFCGQASLGDLDLDGDLEIVVPTANGGLRSIHHNGDAVFSIVFDPSQSYLTSAALANVIGSSEPDVAFAARQWTTHLLLSNGSEAAGWPHNTTANYFLLGPPIMETLDEGSPDVVIGSRDSRGYAWNNLFTNVPGWPKDVRGQCHVSPASGDIDQDGNVEVVFATSTHLIVVDTGGQIDRTDPRGQWPMFGYNPGRTACLSCPENLASNVPDSVLPLHTALRLASPSPSGTPARFRFELEAAAAVRLTVYDATGRLVHELIRDELEAGSHDIAWDGRDGRGNKVASGAYFCRLQAGGQQSVARVLVVR